MPHVTKEKLAEYLASGGAHCPFCGSPNPEGQDCTFDKGILEQEMGCPECQENWTDTYTLTGITPFEDPPEASPIERRVFEPEDSVDRAEKALHVE